jgi:hypothetical protein
MNNGSGGAGSVSVDYSHHQLVEMAVLVIRSRMLHALEHEVDHIGN